MNKKNLIEKAADWAKRQGLLSVKANHNDYESPARFSNPVYQEPIVPDVTGVKAGGKFYVEVVTKTDKIRRMISKWQLLSKLAQVKGGKLYLLAPRGHKTYAQRLIDEYNINAKLVYWKSVA